MRQNNSRIQTRIRIGRRLKRRSTNSFQAASPSYPYYVPPYTGPSQPVIRPIIYPISDISEYPFTINLRAAVKAAVSDLNTEDTITVKNVQELSDSVESTTWDADNPENSFAVPNDDDTLTYKPKGTYFRNALIVDVDVDPAPAAPAAPGNPAPPKKKKRREKVAAVIQRNIIRGKKAQAEMWQTQGANGTCAAMAVGAVLKDRGIIHDQYQIVIDGTLVISPNGTHLNTPTLIGPGGEAPYTVQLQTQAEVKRYRTEGIKWIGNMGTQLHSRDENGDLIYTAEERDRLRVLYPPSTKINPNHNYFSAQDLRWTESFFEHYGDGQRGRHEFATDFAAIIAELRQGNPVILRVDGRELRGKNPQLDIFNTVMSDNDLADANTQSNSNHVVWLTGIDNSDPDNPVFTVVDSASTGGERQYNLRDITAAAEDSEFAYISIGTRPQVLAKRDSFENLAKRIAPEYNHWWGQAYLAAQRHDLGGARANLTNADVKRITGKDDLAEAWAAIQRIPMPNLGDYPDIVAALPRVAPFTSLSNLIEDLNNAKRDIYREFGFDATAYENLKKSVNVE